MLYPTWVNNLKSVFCLPLSFRKSLFVLTVKSQQDSAAYFSVIVSDREEVEGEPTARAELVLWDFIDIIRLRTEVGRIKPTSRF